MSKNIFNQGDRVIVTDDDGDTYKGVVVAWPKGFRGEWYQLPITIEQLPGEVLSVDVARVNKIFAKKTRKTKSGDDGTESLKELFRF